MQSRSEKPRQGRPRLPDEEIRRRIDDLKERAGRVSDKSCGNRLRKRAAYLEAYLANRDGILRRMKDARDAARKAPSKKQGPEAEERVRRRRESARAYYHAHKDEQRDRKRERAREYYHAHKEEMRDQKREAASEYYHAHRDEVLAKARARRLAEKSAREAGAGEEKCPCEE